MARQSVRVIARPIPTPEDVPGKVIYFIASSFKSIEQLHLDGWVGSTYWFPMHIPITNRCLKTKEEVLSVHYDGDIQLTITEAKNYEKYCLTYGESTFVDEQTLRAQIKQIGREIDQQEKGY